jgi:hypothetical protein
VRTHAIVGLTMEARAMTTSQLQDDDFQGFTELFKDRPGRLPVPGTREHEAWLQGLKAAQEG